MKQGFLKAKQVLGIWLGLMGFILLAYNNCGSDMRFQDAPEGSPNASALGNEYNPNRSDDEILADIEETYPEEVEVYRPISDLDSNPELYDVYRCDSTSVYICHFPDNVEAAHTLCVGASAVKSHKKHEATILDGQLQDLSDYLGPCKHAN